jgi:hypothetical protein
MIKRIKFEDSTGMFEDTYPFMAKKAGIQSEATITVTDKVIGKKLVGYIVEVVFDGDTAEEDAKKLLVKLDGRFPILES